MPIVSEGRRKGEQSLAESRVFHINPQPVSRCEIQFILCVGYHTLHVSILMEWIYQIKFMSMIVVLSDPPSCIERGSGEYGTKGMCNNNCVGG